MAFQNKVKNKSKKTRFLSFNIEIKGYQECTTNNSEHFIKVWLEGSSHEINIFFNDKNVNENIKALKFVEELFDKIIEEHLSVKINVLKIAEDNNVYYNCYLSRKEYGDKINIKFNNNYKLVNYDTSGQLLICGENDKQHKNKFTISIPLIENPHEFEDWYKKTINNIYNYTLDSVNGAENQQKVHTFINRQ
ncbi:MAG: hypothetical protein ACP5UN_00175 [Candidatus Micrarchaeia archaeon]